MDVGKIEFAPGSSVPLAVFTTGGCPYCGTLPGHAPERCPAVRAIEYYPTGGIKRVELAR